MIKEALKVFAEALHVLMSCIFYRFHKRTEASFYDHVLQQLGSSRADNFALCALGTTEYGLVTCQVSVTRKEVIHVGGLSANIRAGDPLSSHPRPFGYLRAISSGMLLHSSNFFGHATHILLGSMSLHLTIAQNGKTCNHTHW